MRKLLAIVVILVTVSAVGARPDEVDQARQKIKDVQRKLRINKQQLEQVNAREKELSAELGDTTIKLEDSRVRLAEVQAELDQAEARLRVIKGKIRKARARMRRAQGALERRLRSLYMEGEVSYLAVLMQSDDFTDFLNQADYLKLILKTDSELVAEVRARKEELDRQKAAAKSTVDKLKALRAERADKVAALARLEAAQRSLVAQVQAQRDRLASSVEELEHLSVDMERKLQRLLIERQQPAATLPRSAGAYIYPVNGPITSSFGYRVHPIRGTTRFHSGIDFGVGYGTPILAADNGVVIHSGWYGGYGNCIIINHGGGYSTLYAHCSQLYLGNGASVRQGQTVATVGSTGMSTGPHLHFEVRHFGTPINPMGRL